MQHLPIQIYDSKQPQPYERVFQHMREFTLNRCEQTPDQIWFLQHEAVYTQGQAGKAEHILNPGQIPIVQTDRGGQVTYHGPGQLMIYVLADLKRLDYGIKVFVQHLQNSIILLLKQYGVSAHTLEHAPGVYVQGAKICSLGLRVRKSRSYHGMSLNVNMDLSPFKGINPCGFQQLQMIQIKDFIPDITLEKVQKDLLPLLIEQLYSSQGSVLPHYNEQMFHLETESI